MISRCWWCGDDPLYISYHDSEWGVPIFDDIHLFELLSLEGAQAGLSWITILRKREAYRQLFANFDFEEVATFSSSDIAKILVNPGIVRNKLKLASVVNNAQIVLDILSEYSSFSDYLWQFVGGEPIQNRFATSDEVPAETDLSRTMSKEMKRRGFKFVGPTICYAFMQSAGMVNDHLTSCFRYSEVARRKM